MTTDELLDEHARLMNAFGADCQEAKDLVAANKNNIEFEQLAYTARKLKKAMLAYQIAGNRSRKKEDKPSQTVAREDVFNLPEGPVIVRYPGRLTRESFARLDAYLQLLLRKLARVIVEDSPANQ